MQKGSKLELSILTLWSLFVLIDQHFISLFTFRRLLDNVSDLDTEENISLDTIREALIFQILLKTCAFLDEWDKYLGVNTENEFFDSIIKLKKILKPARRIVEHWKGLRKFRNHVIAHNHRDEKGDNIYYENIRYYHTPETIGDLAYLIFAIEKMVKTLAAAFPKHFSNAVEISKNRVNFTYSDNEYLDKGLTKKEMVKAAERATKEIETNLLNEKYAFYGVTSLYWEFLINAK